MSGERAFANYHHVLSRCKWDGLQGAKILFNLLLPFTKGEVLLIVDEHLERRRGKNIKTRAIYRDPVASSTNWLVKCMGIKWVVVSVMITFPWSKRAFALPFFCVPRKPPTHPSCNKRNCRSGTDIVCQMLCVIRKWHPSLSLTIVGDGDYARAKLAKVCIRLSIGLVSRLRSDARLHKYPTKKQWRGRPVKLGERILPELQHKRLWKKGIIQWYGGVKKKVQWEAYKCLWYASKPETVIPLVAVWVKLRENDEIILMSTDTGLSPQEIIEAYVKRWNLEVTFRECRDHLGIETQRQWSDNAIERTTPLLFSLYSLITMIGHEIYEVKGIHNRSTAWFKKEHLTFSDILVAVRTEIWRSKSKSNSTDYPSSDKDRFEYVQKMEDILAEGL